MGIIKNKQRHGEFDMQATGRTKQNRRYSTRHSPDAHMDVFVPEINDTNEVLNSDAVSNHLASRLFILKYVIY